MYINQDKCRNFTDQNHYVTNAKLVRNYIILLEKLNCETATLRESLKIKISGRTGKFVTSYEQEIIDL